MSLTRHSNPLHPGEPWGETATMATPPGISVSDLAELAKAGVTINLSEIAQHVRPDVPTRTLFDSTQLTRPLVERLHRYNEIKQGPNADRWHIYPDEFFFSAWTNREKVFIFACPLTVDCKPVILEDEALLYPSDALMAKLHLLLKSHPQTAVNGPPNYAGQSASQAPRVNPVPPLPVTPP